MTSSTAARAGAVAATAPGVVQLARRIVAEEGVRALWNGVGPVTTLPPPLLYIYIYNSSTIMQQCTSDAAACDRVFMLTTVRCTHCMVSYDSYHVLSGLRRYVSASGQASKNHDPAGIQLTRGSGGVPPRPHPRVPPSASPPEGTSSPVYADVLCIDDVVTFRRAIFWAPQHYAWTNKRQG